MSLDFGRRVAEIYEDDCELFHDSVDLRWMQKIASIDRSYSKGRARVGTDRAEERSDC